MAPWIRKTGRFRIEVRKVDSTRERGFRSQKRGKFYAGEHGLTPTNGRKTNLCQEGLPLRERVGLVLHSVDAGCLPLYYVDINCSAAMRKPVNDFFMFLLGSSLLAGGLYLFSSQVMVDSGFRSFGWRRYGGFWGSPFGTFLPFGAGQGFGLLMLPLGVGVALLVADGQRKLGWFLIWASSAALGVGILQSLVFNFRTTSLFSLMTMVVMVGAGGALMFRSLKDYDAEAKNKQQIEIDEANQRLRDLKQDLDDLKSSVDKK
jgi:hypothetical protein